MSRNKLKRKQDKQKKKESGKAAKLSKIRKSLTEKKKIEKQTSDMQREMERLQNRLSGVTIRKSQA